MQTPSPESAQTISRGSLEPHTVRAFVVSLVGLVVFPVAIVGLILSIIAYVRAQRLGAATGLAVAGMVCGCIGCWLLVFAVFLLLGYAAGYYLVS